jgi:uncharacterized membrane protein YjfL (UPF0719 family)
MMTNTLLEHPFMAAALVDLQALLAALIYSAMGLALFGIAWVAIVKISPFSIRKEIEDDQNTALGIVIGSVIIGLSIVIAAAIGE